MLGTMYDMPSIPGIQPTIVNRGDFPSSSNFLKRTVFTASGTWIKSGGCNAINLKFNTAIQASSGVELHGELFYDATSINNIPVTISSAQGGSSSFGSIASMTNYNGTGPVQPTMAGMDYFNNGISSTSTANLVIGAQIVVEEYA